MWRRNAAGVDSVQAQGIMGCRAGIVGVDGDRDRRHDARELTVSKRRTRARSVRGTSEIVAYTLK